MANPENSQQGAAEVGGAGNQHKDWGHSEVGRSRQSVTPLDDVVGSATGHPSQESGEAPSGLGWVESLSTGTSGNSGNRQSNDRQ